MFKQLRRGLAWLLAAAMLCMVGCAGGTTSSGTTSTPSEASTVSGTTSQTEYNFSSPVATASDAIPMDPADPVAHWRTTPEKLSLDPSSKDFRLDASHYENIAWPAYSKDDPTLLVEYTEEQKAEQRSAGKDLKKAVLQAVINKIPAITIEPGVYRFVNNDVPLELNGAKNLTIIGEGVELILEGQQRAFNLKGCQNVTLVGFTVDRDPRRNTQFEVLAQDWEKKEMTVKVMEGYDPSRAPAQGDIQLFAQDGTWQQQVFTHYTSFRWTDEKNRIGVYSGATPSESGAREWLIGSLGSTILNGGTVVMYLVDSDSCNFVDITNYSGCMMAGGEGNTGNFYFLRNKDMARPGTNGLVAGGFGLVQWLDGGPIVEDCVYGRTNDDAMDILAWNSAMYKQESPNTILVVTMIDCPFNVGDTVRLYEEGKGTWYGEAKITALEVVTDAAEMENAKKVFPDERWNAFGNQENFIRLTLDKEFSLKVGDVVENYTSYRPDRVVIKGTLFHDVFCRVLLQGAKETTLENNVFIRTGLPALLICDEMYGFAEGKTVENITIKDNTFVDSPWSPYTTYGTALFTGTISIGLGDAASNGANLSKPIKNVVIENNHFIRPMFSAIQVKNVDGLVIRNNVIDSPVMREGLSSNNPINPGQQFYGAKQNAAIFLYACANITLENNTVNTGEGHCEQDVVRLNCE